MDQRRVGILSQTNPHNENDIDFLRSKIIEYVDSHADKVNARFAMLEELLDNMDKQLATLALTTGENIVLLAGLVAVSETWTDDQKEIFNVASEKAYGQMLKNLEGNLVDEADAG